MKVGNTPLAHDKLVASWAGISALYLKDETKNPSGSFKDRGSWSAFTHHFEKRQNNGVEPRIGTVSTGNMAISTAWMGGQFNQKAFVVVNEGISDEKVRVIKAASGDVGVDIFVVNGNYSDFHDVVKSACSGLRRQGRPVYAELTDDYNRCVGYTTLFAEIIDQMASEEVDFIFVPGASGAFFRMAVLSLEKLKDQGLIEVVPRVVLVQEEGGDAISQAFKKGRRDVPPIKLKDSLVAKAIAVSNARKGNLVLSILKKGYHQCLSVTTQEIRDAQQKLFESNFFVQPAAAASLAAAKKLVGEEKIMNSNSVVCVLTGGELSRRSFTGNGQAQDKIIRCDLKDLFDVLMANLSGSEWTMKNLIDKVRKDEKESLNTLHLTAYENRLSKLAQSFLKSTLSHRYHLGTIEEHQCQKIVTKGGRFMYKGLPGVYAMEKVARDRAQEMFHAALTDFRPTSGLHAMICTMAAATEPGDLVYSIAPDDGGHFATKHVLERLGRQSQYIPWDLKDLTPDLDAFAKKIKKSPPSAIFFEHGTPLFNLPVREIRELVGEDVLMIYDASHTQGLIAGGQFQDPLREGCNILQGNTHKTFPGPQKGMIHFRDLEYGRNISASLSAGMVSSQHTHHAIAEYITVLEMYEFGKAYAKQMMANANKLAKLLVGGGFELVEKDGVYTTSHEIMIKGDALGGYLNACRRLFACNISTNARVAFHQKVIRLGTQEVTRRGMKEKDMQYLARLFKRALIDKESSVSIKRDVLTFNRSFPNIHYSFDREFGYWE